MRLPLASSAADPLDTGLPPKFLQNMFSEPNPNDPQRKLQLVETPGTLAVTLLDDPIRGMAQADGFAGGKIIICAGTVLYTHTPGSGVFTPMTGAISGTDRVQFTFTETEMAVLGGGYIHVSTDGTSVTPATDGVTTSPGLVIGSTPANVANVAFSYSINEVVYSKGAVAAGTAPGNDVIPLGLYGAVALDIDAAGTITVAEATGNATGYASASLAVAGLPALAVNTIRFGIVTATKSDGAFTFGTTALNAANTTVTYTSAPVNTGFTDLLADHGQTVFTSIAAIGQRLVFTYGSRFGFSDVLDMASTNALNYYTAESSPDALVGGVVLAELYYLFGTDTIEPWAQTSDADDPFQLQPGMTLQIGCLCRDGVVKTDNSLYFVDDACNVRRMGVGQAEIVFPNDPWVSRSLKSVAASTVVGMTHSDGGHIFIIYRTDVRCIVYDVMTGVPHTRGSNQTNVWRWSFMVEIDGDYFVGDTDGYFDKLSRDYPMEHMTTPTTGGDYITREWSGFGAVTEGRDPIASVRSEGSKGIGLVSGQGVNPVVQLRISTDNGQTFCSWRDAYLGAQGDYSTRTIWRRLGRARPPGVLFHFRKSDPVRLIVTGCAVGEDG